MELRLSPLIVASAPTHDNSCSTKLQKNALFGHCLTALPYLKDYLEREEPPSSTTGREISGNYPFTPVRKSTEKDPVQLISLGTQRYTDDTIALD